MNALQTNKTLTALSTAGLSDNYTTDITTFNKWLGGRRVNAATIAEFFAARMETRAPSTVRRNKSAIKKALRLSMGAGVTLGELSQFRAFFDEIKPGKVNNAVTDEKILTPAEIGALIKASGHKTGLIIRALFETACRVSELMNVELKDCHPGRKEISITVYRSKTKTTDTVYMERGLYNEIVKAYGGEKYLFEGKGGRALSRYTVHTLIKHAGAKIGRPQIHAHTLRHSWATAALAELGLVKVSKYLGHSRPDTCSRFYLHGRASEEEITAVTALQIARGAA
jgi:integrase/recombinase XerD